MRRAARLYRFFSASKPQNRQRYGIGTARRSAMAHRYCCQCGSWWPGDDGLGGKIDFRRIVQQTPLLPLCFVVRRCRLDSSGSACCSQPGLQGSSRHAPRPSVGGPAPGPAPALKFFMDFFFMPEFRKAPIKLYITGPSRKLFIESYSTPQQGLESDPSTNGIHPHEDRGPFKLIWSGCCSDRETCKKNIISAAAQSDAK